MFDVFYQGPKPGLFVFEQPATTLEEAAENSKTEFFWFIHGSANYDNFDFDWRCPPWENEHVHVFPSQWQVNGDVYFAHKDHARKRAYNFRTEQIITRTVDMTNWVIPKGIDDSEFDYSWHPNSVEPPYEYHFATQWQKDGGPIYKGTAGLKYTSAQKIRVNATQIFYMDFMNPESKEQFAELKKQWPDIKLTRYVDNHLNVLTRIMNLADTEFVWVISSICRYDDFDFTWHPDVSQRDMIHCFFNDFSEERRGDTFYINVASFKSQMVELELLDWFNVINYIPTTTVTRYPSPIHYYETDDLVSEIKNYEFKTPFVVFTNNDKIQQYRVNTCAWTKKDRSVMSLSLSNATVAVPRDIKADLKSQIYDYPYIDTEKVRNYYAEQPSDIIYISNGEPDEERWFKHLRESIIFTGRNKDTANLNRLKWIRNVNGRVAAYQAAAKASATPWFIAIFAKLEVANSELWEWTPDYFQEPKHYIFNSKNVLNGLEYGHQGAIAYNKKLVLENNNPGIDFTLSQPHASVPILSGFAHFNQNPWMTWRTAFREVLKLKHFQETAPTVETAYRLKKWLTVAEGEHAEWCLRGASDAIEYYELVNGDYSKLMLSFEWAWLKEYYDSKY